MRLLFDTNAWLWSLLPGGRLSEPARQALSDRGNGLHVSPVTTWEVMVLSRRGRVSLPLGPDLWMREAIQRVRPTTVALDHDIAIRSEQLDGLETSDPADRFIVATAIAHDLVLVTADEAMRAFGGVRTLW